MSSQLATSLTDRDPPEEGLVQLERWEHTDIDGTPYFDEVLQVAQSIAHQIAVSDLGSILEIIAGEAGLVFTSDHPIWYIHPDEPDRQRRSYGDLVISRQGTEPKRMIATDVLVLIEVVSTHERRKEIKDTLFQRGLAEYNSIPEFGLIFPEEADPRSLIWYVFNQEADRYDELSLSPGSEVEVRGVPGLQLRVKPADQWERGRKIDVFFQGEPRLPLRQERQRAEQERQRAEQERQRAEQERQRAERLAAKLRELGVEPEE